MHEGNGQHLGTRHFELIEKAAEEMLDFLLVNSLVPDNHLPLVEERELHNSQDSSASESGWIPKACVKHSSLLI